MHIWQVSSLRLFPAVTDTLSVESLGPSPLNLRLFTTLLSSKGGAPNSPCDWYFCLHSDEVLTVISMLSVDTVFVSSRAKVSKAAFTPCTVMYCIYRYVVVCT